jgi:glycosyltransferase involved in cell wall biosynthesis
MKVAIFTGTLLLNEANTDVRKKYVIERLKYFNQYALNVEVVTPIVNLKELELHRHIIFNTYKFFNIKHFKLLSVFVFSLNKLVKLDCGLLHCYTYQAAIIAIFVNYFRNRKYFVVFEPMGLAYEELKLNRKCSTKDKFFSKFVRVLERITFKKSHRIIVYTQIYKKYISQKFNLNENNIYIVPHGVDLCQSDSLETKKTPALSKLNIPITNKIIMYVGSLSELHGTPHLMGAMKYLNSKRQDITFIILGSGPLEHTLSKFVTQNQFTNVLLLGFVPSKEVPFYLKSADVLVIPHGKCMQTELDPPTKLFEYLASGKPIVSFNLKAISEVVGNDAVLVEPDNPVALADGILRLLNDETLANNYGENGKNIIQKYSWEMSAKRQYEVYILCNKIIKNNENMHAQLQQH